MRGVRERLGTQVGQRGVGVIDTGWIIMAVILSAIAVIWIGMSTADTIRNLLRFQYGADVPWVLASLIASCMAAFAFGAGLSALLTLRTAQRAGLKEKWQSELDQVREEMIQREMLVEDLIEMKKRSETLKSQIDEVEEQTIIHPKQRRTKKNIEQRKAYRKGVVDGLNTGLEEIMQASERTELTIDKLMSERDKLQTIRKQRKMRAVLERLDGTVSLQQEEEDSSS